GYGREGKSTEQFINTYCSVASLEVFEGKREDIDESKYDYIIKSPGIHAEDLSDKYTSQTELFLEEFSARTIGITGTKGKSTTSSLMYHVLSDCLDSKVFLVGNIGIPCLDFYDKIDADTVVVFEMSCHQLAKISCSPHIAVFLNLYEEHLDYYKTLENYFSKKKNITLFQTEKDYFYYGDNVPEIETKATAQMIQFDSGMRFDMKLLGEHNQFNAVFVYKVCSELFGLSDAKIRESIATFEGLNHRMQYVGNYNGIDFYNDSISTIPNATIQAINSIQNTKTVLIGGMDRKIDYSVLVDFIKKHNEYYYIMSYESGKRIYNEVSQLDYCCCVEDLKEAVEKAKEITPKGKACVFSPAAASYGYFKNFEERGEAYMKHVREG
ncbi:MAG: UDP-N-acetylmuramoyl-L-alanine--D-glutamate ligase, partial [Clostridia bacterium]|nr:UDP-N-acetylmuramoyl-L-alanine--D-glutamate ligase [Clostridia bacterium]